MTPHDTTPSNVPLVVQSVSENHVYTYKVFRRLTRFRYCPRPPAGPALAVVNIGRMPSSSTFVLVSALVLRSVLAFACDLLSEHDCWAAALLVGLHVGGLSQTTVF